MGKIGNIARIALAIALVVTFFSIAPVAMAGEGDFVITQFETGNLKTAVDNVLNGTPYTSVSSLSFDANAGALNSTDFATIRALTNLNNLDMSNVSMSQNSDTLPEWALSGHTGLRMVTLPAGVSVIGDYSFNNCSSLEHVTGTITSVGASAFSYCESLQGVTGTITSVGNFGLNYCRKLSSIALAQNTPIGSSAFQYCQNLTTVSGTISSLGGSFAFNHCEKLEGVQLVGVTSIPNAAFQDCWALTTIGDITIGTMGSSSFTRCYKLESIKLKDGIEFPTNAFYNCTALTTVTGKPKVVGYSAFDGCALLETIDLSGATEIGGYAFDGCKSLETADLSNVTSVDARAFLNCSSFYDVKWMNLASAPIGAYAFYGCALDFSGNFTPPTNLAASQSGGQTPRVYFKLERSADTITQGTSLTPPWSLKTKNGTPYEEILDRAAYPWVVDGLTVPTVTPNPAWDITAIGTRKYDFELEPSVFANTHSYKLTVYPRPTPVLTVTPPTASLEVDETMQLTASESGVTWKSADEKVAAVDANGLVTAVGAGTTDITATASDGRTASCRVTVTKPDDPEPPEVFDIGIEVLAVKKGKELILPVLKGYTGTWSVGDGSVAKLTKNGKRVKALKVGETELTFTVSEVVNKKAAIVLNDRKLKAGESYTIKFNVRKAGQLPTKLTLDKKKLTLNLGENKAVKLTATVKPDKALDKQVFWTSNKPGVVTVDKEGNVTAAGPGTAKITAVSANLKRATATVTVEGGVTKVALSAKKKTLAVGDTFELTER